MRRNVLHAVYRSLVIAWTFAKNPALQAAKYSIGIKHQFGRMHGRSLHQNLDRRRQYRLSKVAYDAIPSACGQGRIKIHRIDIPFVRYFEKSD